MPYAHVNGISLYYETRGVGPPVLLISGLRADGHFWLHQTPALAGRFQVIRPDNRGAGRSDKPDLPYTLAMMAADLRGLLDVLAIPSAHVVGASMGGFIAQEFALAYPERVRGLVLCCTSFGGPEAIPIPPETLQVLASQTGDPAQDLRAFLAVQFATDYPQRHPEEIDAYVAWRVAHPQPLFAYQRQLAAAAAHDTADRLGRVRCPVLILHGAEDRVVPAGNAERLAARIPGARLNVFPRAGHLFLWECAEEANREIAAFLEAG